MVQLLYLLLTYSEQALLIEEKVLSRVLRQPLRVILFLKLLLLNLLLFGVADVILGLDDNAILYECLVFFVEDGLIQVEIFKATFIIIRILALLLLTLLFLILLNNIYLCLWHHSKSIIN